MHETSSDNGKDVGENLVRLPLTDNMLSKLQLQDMFFFIWKLLMVLPNSKKTKNDFWNNVSQKRQ